MKRWAVFFLFTFCSGNFLLAQDMLPKFSLLNKGNNRIVVSWNNPYGTAIKQLSIQRSYDSLKSFTTILTLPDPTVPQNGFVDTKAPSDKLFYRLYILLDSGVYLFSKSKRPILDTVKAKPSISTTGVVEKEPNYDLPDVQPKIIDKDKIQRPGQQQENIKPKELPERIIYIKKKDSLVAAIGEKKLKPFKDSIAYKTKDTLLYVTIDTLLIKPFVPKEVYKPSKYVFTDKDGNIKILLPDAAQKKYTLKFFDEDGSVLLDIKKLPESVLILDKSNFHHAGWYKFELYNNAELVERHRLFLSKDF